MDRFARSALDALQWLKQLDGCGVGFKILTQDIDTTTATGRLVFTILAAVAEMERELISERVIADMARAKAEGKPIGQARRRTWSPQEHRRFAEVRALVMAGTSLGPNALASCDCATRIFAAALREGGRDSGPAEDLVEAS